MVPESTEVEFLSKRPAKEGQIVRSGTARVAGVELVPYDARGRFSPAVSKGDDRAAGVSEGDKVTRARRRTKACRAEFDKAGCHDFRATKVSHGDVTEPVGACTTCDRGFMQHNDTVSTSFENVVIEAGGGFDVGGAK